MNSWDKGDSHLCDEFSCNNCKLGGTVSCCEYGIGEFIIGPNDLDLAQRLCNAGSDHRKFLRQIFVSVDITAPLYWWKEYDTYKVGTTANSTSTMHKIHAKEFEVTDFSYDKLHADGIDTLKTLLEVLNCYRDKFNETKNKDFWYGMIQLLPSSYNQMRTCTMTYENLRNMYHARKNHKLDEWREFTKWVETLPYAKELIISE